MELSTNKTSTFTTVTYPSMEFATEFLSKWLPLFFITIGILGNTMSLLVTTKKDNRRISTCVYMAALASVDTVVLLNEIMHTLLVIHGLGKSLETSLIYLR
jgi:hypothetical protein